MANTYNLVDWLSMDSLRLLKNKLQVAQFFNTDYNKEFRKSYAIGDTVTVELPQRFSIREGLPYNPMGLGRPTTTIKVDNIFGVDFEWDDIEGALKMDRPQEAIRRNTLEPAMATIAQEIDSRAAYYATQHTNNIVGILGTDPASFAAVSGAARQRMIELAAPPSGERGMIVSPSVNAALAATTLPVFNPSSEISRIYKEGSLGRQGGFDWYESMSIYQHTAGTWAGAVTVNGANQSGSILNVTATTGDTFKKGDVIGLALVYAVNPMTRRETTRATTKTFVITADVTAVASAAALPIEPAITGPGSVYQNVSVLPASGAVVTLFPGTSSPSGKTGSNGLAIQKDAFALVGVRLQMPKAVEVASQTRDPETGISVRFVRAWDPVMAKMINRFDVLLGFGNLYPESSAVRVLGA